ncbi:MAG: hypothetical protein U0795_14005 [Pirellulales bacterium]
MSIGVVFLLLLNGQIFTNAVVFLCLCLMSCLLWISVGAQLPQRGDRRIVRYVVLGHIAIIVAVSLTLPGRYQWQAGFNARVEQLRDAANSNR